MIKLARYAVDAIKLSNPAGNLIFPADMIKSLFVHFVLDNSRKPPGRFWLVIFC